MTSAGFSTETIHIATLPSGDKLTTQAITLSGGHGKRVYIQANNHGGEIAGNLAIVELLRILREKEINGTIVLVPQVNPVSLNQKFSGTRQGQFHDATGHNFNRQFKLLVSPTRSESEAWQIVLDEFVDEHRDKSDDEIGANFKKRLCLAIDAFYEESSKRGAPWRDHFSFQLQRRSHDADIFLDLHTGDRAVRYLYAFRPEMASVPYFNSAFTLAMDELTFAGAADEAHYVPWAKLRDAFRRVGREFVVPVESFTVELGSIETLDFDAAKEDAENIVSYLQFHGVIAGEPLRREMHRFTCSMDDYHLYSAPAAGLTVWRKQPGDWIAAKEQVAEILSMRALRSFDDLDAIATPVIAQREGILITRNHNPIVSEGTELFKMMTNVQEI